MPFSLYARNKFLDHVHGKAAFAMPTVYVGYSTTTPNATDGNITEPAGGAYARVAVPAASWAAAASGAITNTAQINFPTATGSWGTVTHFAAYDAATGGNVLFWGTVPNAAVTTNITPNIPVSGANSTFTA